MAASTASTSSGGSVRRWHLVPHDHQRHNSPSWHRSTLRNSGGYPVAGVVQGRDGNFYGPTLEGGLSDYGTLFRVTSANAFSALRSFNGDNGAYSSSLLLQAADGNFYGTAENGGTNGGWGTVFRTTAAGVITPLVSFNYTNGGIPVAGLVQDTDGTFYGTTYYGGDQRRRLGLQNGRRRHTHFPLLVQRRHRRQQPVWRAAAELATATCTARLKAGAPTALGTVFRIISRMERCSRLAHFDGYQGANPGRRPRPGRRWQPLRHHL